MYLKLNLRSTLFIILFAGLFSLASGQGYSITNYTDESGLSSNLVKTCIQDDDGYLWVGTDAGIALYNSRQFTPITSILPSIYIKDIIQTKDKSILVVTDLGIGYIKKSNSGYSYESFLKGATKQTDTLLSYPKSIYQDRNGAFWISNQNSIMRYENGKLKKYSFDPIYSSDSYFRSFLLIEDRNSNLFAASWQGFLFRFDKKSDNFILLDFNPSKKSLINDITIGKGNSLILGTGSGMYEVKYSHDFKITSSNIFISLGQNSYFSDYGNDDYLIGTWNDGAYLWSGESKSLTKLSLIEAKTINNISKDREGGYWFSTDEGISLLKKTPFIQAVFLTSPSQTGSSYIRNLSLSNDGQVCFSDQENIFKVIEKNKHLSYENVFNSKGKRVYSFDISGDCIWASLRNGDLICKNGSKTTSFTSKQLGGRIAFTDIDLEGNCWGVVENTTKIVKISPDFNFKYYTIPDIDHRTYQIKIDTKGVVNFIYADTKFHLFKFSKSNDKFEPVSFSPDIELKENLLIFDFQIPSPDKYCIASSNGYFEITDGKLEDCTPPNFSENKVFKSIAYQDNETKWFGTEKELFLQKGKEVVSFNKKDGLPNSAIAPRGTVVDKNGRVWAATPSGLAYWQSPSVQIDKTSKPVIHCIDVNTKHSEFMGSSSSFDDVSDILYAYSSLSYPNRIIYQTRILGISNEWTDQKNNNSFQLPHLPTGDYVFQVRAQQSGRLWSDITEHKFSVIQKWYLRTWMIAVYILAAIFLVVLFERIYHRAKIKRMEFEKYTLETLVNEKTKDLIAEKEISDNLLKEAQKSQHEIERTNEELKKANDTKSDLLSIAAHDLKTPLANVMAYAQVLQEEVPSGEPRKFADIIYQSSINMLSIITEILDSVALESMRFELELSAVNINELITKIISLNHQNALRKNQNIEFESSGTVLCNIDKKWMKAAIDNLISNAVKYSPLNSDIKVFLAHENGIVKMSVTDKGQGLTENDKVNLFGKFKRLSAAPTAGESSTGLGLSIARDIVKLHKGDILCQSEPGKGATFTIQFPSDL